MKTNHMLAMLALLGGLAAAFTSFSAKNDLYPTWKYESGRVKGGKVDYISASHLADLLYRKDRDLFLLDLRSAKEYQSYHIPTARPSGEGTLDRDQKKTTYVVYGLDPELDNREQLDTLAGKVYVLKGGMEAWFSQVLFPDFSEYKVRNRDQLEHILRRSKFFGGSPANTQLLNIEQRQSSYREGC
jgi:rhodanese-related sulfurtransferase